MVLPSDALIVVDVQRDFCPGGALAVSDGDAVVPVINRLIPRFGDVYFTRDWHPENHCSFSSNPQFVDRSWPRHCVAYTPGAAFHRNLHVPPSAVRIYKGIRPEREAYSGFQGTNLLVTLRTKGTLTLYVCGLATDYCVKQTVLDGLRAGFAVCVVEDAVRAVDIPAGSGKAAADEMMTAGARFVASKALL